MNDPYLWLKWIHILSSTVLFGTGLGTALHMLLAQRSGNVQAIAVVARNVVRADWLCTLPSGILQPLSGALLVYKGGWQPGAPWLVVTYILYVVAGLCWVIVVGLQIEMARLATDAAQAGEALPPRYHRLFRWWFTLGWPAFLGLMAIYAMMVMKPG